MTRTIEHSFMLVSNEELDLGIKYAAKKDLVTLQHLRLRTIANNAGKYMHGAPGLTPRQAAAKAMQAYHNEYPSVQFPSPYFEGYVHAVAKIMNGRSPRVVAKRERDRKIADINLASFGIEWSKPLDPEVQRDLFEATKAGAH